MRFIAVTDEISVKDYRSRFITILSKRNSLPKLDSIKDIPVPVLEKDTGTCMFNAALSTIAKTWKQPKCPSTDEWIKKMWYNGILLSLK